MSPIPADVPDKYCWAVISDCSTSGCCSLNDASSTCERRDAQKRKIDVGLDVIVRLHDIHCPDILRQDRRAAMKADENTVRAFPLRTILFLA